nr:putative amino acid permease 7 [Quercus suber]
MGPLHVLYWLDFEILEIKSKVSQAVNDVKGHVRSYCSLQMIVKLGSNHHGVKYMIGIKLHGPLLSWINMAIQHSFEVAKCSCDDDGRLRKTGQFRNQTAITKKGTKFHVHMIVMSQIPDFHKMEWLSVVAAMMSFTYSFIGIALGFAKVIENGKIMGSITGVPASTLANKLWLVFEAFGDIAFAYPYSIIVLEIQDTLKSPPPENQTMKRASMVAIFVTTCFYLCCGCFGYAAFGNDTPGNILTGFGFYEPYWLIDFANACVVLHLVGGYQIYSQPVFAFCERWFTKKFPNSGFVNNFYTIKLPLLPGFQWNLLRLCFRTAYVVSSTGIAMLFPYFNSVLGLLGALNFWPLTIYFPVEMYFVQKKVGAWTKKWIALQTFSFVCFLVTVVGFIGSLEAIISAKLS